MCVPLLTMLMMMYDTAIFLASEGRHPGFAVGVRSLRCAVMLLLLLISFSPLALSRYHFRPRSLMGALMASPSR